MQQSQHQLGQQSTLRPKGQMQQQHQLANNIIVLRGSRNENGQIVIENKPDILAFLSEQQQQQQQQSQHEKREAIESSVTDAVLTQLPLSTTIARKILPQQKYPQRLTTTIRIGNDKSKPSNTNTNNGIQLQKATTQSKSSEYEKSSVELDITPSNTILLQTPINANQLETVLLQTQQAANIKRLATDNQCIVKESDHNTRSKNSTSSTAHDINKGPYLLQTLKRLEKSQSILVIRNSGAVTSSFTSNSAVTLSSTQPNTQQNAYTTTNSTSKFILSTSENAESLENKNSSIPANIFITTTNNSNNSVRLTRTQQQTPRRTTKVALVPAVSNRSGRLISTTTLSKTLFTSAVSSTPKTYLVSNSVTSIDNKTAGNDKSSNQISSLYAGNNSSNSSNSQFKKIDEQSTKCTTTAATLEMRSQQKNIPIGNGK